MRIACRAHGIALAFPAMLAALLLILSQDATRPGFIPEMYKDVPGVQMLSGSIIVKPLDDAESREVARSLLSPLQASYQEVVGYYVVDVPEGFSDLEFSSWLWSLGIWKYIEPNLLWYGGVEPDDPYYRDSLGALIKWDLDLIGCPAAWDLITDLSNVTVAIVDTGISSTHSDLVVAGGYNSTGLSSSYDDASGHGTSVAGMLGATGNNTYGICGVGWSTTMLSVRASNATTPYSGIFSAAWVNAGAVWAAQQGAVVVNASVPGVATQQSTQDTGESLKDTYDCLYVFAAGNTGTELTYTDWDDLIIVSASTINDTLWNNSCYGDPVDCAAPGAYVMSTHWTDSTGVQETSGTSYAAPLASGVLTLMRAANPFLDAQEIEDRFFASCLDLGTAGEDDDFGAGRIQADEALNGALIGSISVSAPTLVAGTTATLTATGAQPSTSLYFTYTFTGLGTWRDDTNELALILDAPSLAGVVTSDSSGGASCSQFIPSNRQGQTVWIQVAEPGGNTSNVVSQVIQ